MTFPDYATKETTELVERLMARHSDDFARQLRTLRDALERAAREIGTPPPPDPAIRDLADRLDGKFSEMAARIREDADVALEATRRDLDAARADLESTRAELDSVCTDLESVREDLEATRADLEANRAYLDAERHAAAELSASLKDLRTEHAAAIAGSQLANQVKAGLEEELRDARELLARADRLAETLDQRLESTLAENSSLREAVLAAEQARDELVTARAAAESRASLESQARTAAEREIQTLRTSLDGALADLEHLGSKLEAASGERGRLVTEVGTAQNALQSAQAQQESLAAQLRAQTAKIQALERNHARQEELILQLQARLETEPQVSPEVTNTVASGAAAAVHLGPEGGDLSPVISLLDASVKSVDALGTAATIPDLMNALLAQLSVYFSRVALFTLKGNRLAGESQMGFDHHTYVRKMVIPLGVDSMLTRVANTGQLEWFRGEELTDESKGAPFRGTPAVAVALPLKVRDEIVAVVYADDAARGEAQDPTASQVRVRLARLLVHQAALSLMRLNHELRAMAELRQYATTLIEGVEQMYTADAESRRTPEDTRRRLQDNVECARQIFTQRASSEGLDAAMLLDEQIAALVQSRSDDQFARELARLAGIPYAAPPQSAEAS